MLVAAAAVSSPSSVPAASAAVPSAPAEGRQSPLKGRDGKSRGLGAGGLVVAAEGLHLVGDVHGVIAVHLHDLVSDVEEGAGAPRHQDGGDAGLLVEISGPLQERGDGLLVPADHLLHEIVPHHKVGGGGVLVDEEEAGAGLNVLHHAGRLGGASAGVGGGEGGGVLLVGQVVDEHGNVHAADGAPVLRPELHRRVVGDDKLSAVPGDVVVDAVLQGFQQGGFSVIAAAHDEGDALRDGHAGDFPAVGQLEGALHGRGGDEGDAVLQGQVGDAALSGENGAVGHESGQLLLPQDPPHLRLVLRQEHAGLHLLRIQLFVEEAVLHAAGEKIKENFVQLPRVDGAAEGRKSHVEAGDDAGLADLAGAPLQHFLAAAGDGEKATLAGAFGLEIEVLKLGGQPPGEEILQGDAGAVLLPGEGGKSRILVGDLHVEAGRGGEGVSLHMVDGQQEAAELIGSGQGFVGRIAFMVDGAQHGAQLSG